MEAKIGPKRLLGGVLGGSKRLLGSLWEVSWETKGFLEGPWEGWGAKTKSRAKKVRNWASKGRPWTPPTCSQN